ncbi:MAG TPA: protease pro-enzyme activation domain-containing protein [Thermoplasmata archaeon]|nr:protease pro-enzyme activation domain-containing protein [Thermoplasmata archaeon]
MALLIVMTVGFGAGASIGAPLAPSIAGHVPGISVSEVSLPTSGWSVSELRASAPASAPYDEPGLGLPGAVYLGAPNLKDPANPSGTIDILLTLAFSNESRLNALLSALSNPSSPQYHHYLTASQFDAQFGASPPVYRSLVSFLGSFGVSGITTHPDRLAVSFEATLAQATAIFHTPIGAYLSGAGQPFYAPRTAPQLPSLLTPYLVDVEGLSNFSEYQNHLAPIAALEASAAALAGDAATGGRIPAVIPISPHETPLSPGGASNPFASTTVTSNGLTNTYDQPAILTLQGKSGTCDTNDCGSFVQAPDLQVTYNETGLFQTYGYPVNATVAAVLWSDPICHANTGTCSSEGLYNYYCSTLTSGSAAWDFFMPDVTSFWKYSLPAGEPSPRAISMPIAGYTYAYPAGSQGYSASCDDGEAEGENTLDVDMLGAMAPGANVFQAFGGSASSTSIDTVVADILSPTTAEFSTAGGFDTAANVRDLTNVSVISNSWTTNGILPAAFTTDLKTAQARGITVLGATGDSGTTLAPPAEIGANTYGTVAVGGTTAAINATTLQRGAPHVASAAAPYYGVGRGEIGWYEPAGTVDGFSSTYGGTGGVATSATYYRASWFNASSDAQSVANAVRSGNYRVEPDVSGIANDTIVDLEVGPYSLNFTCWVSTGCTAVSSMAVGTISGSSPTVGGTYFIGTSIATQVVAGQIATIDHSLYVEHEGWLGYLNPGAYPMGQKQYGSDLTLRSFYDVTTFTDAGGLTAAYEAKSGYDLATGWGVIDTGNYTRNALTYPITFTESGLPAGSLWSVTLTPEVGDASCMVSGSVCSNPSTTSSTGTTITFNEAYGTFAYKVNLIAGYSPAPGAGSVAVRGAAVGVGVVFTQVSYSVSFTESGLPSGTSWSVTLNGHPQSSTASTITFSEPNGSFGYSIGGVAGYAASPSSGSVTVNGAPVSTGIVFTQTTYTVAFSESGLPSGQMFRVTFGGVPETTTTDGGTDALTFTVPNGTYPYAISDIAGYHQSTLPASGTVVVSGAGVSEPTLVYAPVTYAVTFTESGLPGGTSWTVTLNGLPESATGGSIGFSEANGTFGFTVSGEAGYTATPNSGTVAVNGAATGVAIVFTPVTYSVTFSESGLPAGVTFQVTLNGAPESLLTDGSTDSLTFSVANGTFGYTIAGISGYRQSTLPSSGSVVVSGASVVEPTLLYGAVTYAVGFTETGLPAGTLWSVTLNGDTESTTGSSLSFSEPNGTYGYTVGAVAGYRASPNAGTVGISGAGGSTSISFTAVNYTLTFSESGLPGGSLWTVTLGGGPPESATGPSIAFTEPNGTYGYTVSGPAGYTAAPHSGSVRVDGVDASVAIVFTPVTYAVTFTESGLPSGTLWSVTLNGDTESATGSAIFFGEPNGSYGFTVGGIAGYRASPNAGSVSVNGGAVSVGIGWTPVVYTVTVGESGLPAGTLWSVTLDGSTESATSTAIAFLEPNGTYGFSIGGIAGYRASPNDGTVTVSGADASVPIDWTQVTYAVTFTETGLPSGTLWSVTLDGHAVSSGGVSIQFSEPNGTYDFSVGGVPGYHAAPRTGSVSVTGTAVSLGIAFTPVSYSVAFSESGLPAGETFRVTLGGTPESLTTDGLTDTLGFTVPNGTYAYTLTAVAGWEQTTLPFSGSVAVSGADVAEPTLAYTAVTYSVTFTESGLPGGTFWSATLNGNTESSTGPSIVFRVTNGTYGFSVSAVAGYTATPASGTVGVAGGPRSVGIVYAPPSLYAVTFSEGGLPGGTSWAVTVGATTESSTGSSIAFSLPNGTYAWTIGAIPGYTPNLASGSLTVDGSAVSVAIEFSHHLYRVEFSELGLPSGHEWAVVLNGSVATGTGATITFLEPNGSFVYLVHSFGAFRVTNIPPEGTLAVHGADVTQGVMFARGTTYGIHFDEKGLASGTPWCVTLGGTTCSTTATIVFAHLTPGTYSYAVASVGTLRTIVRLGGVVVPASGPTTIAHGETFQVRFGFPVSFTESGLANGTDWKVSAGGTSATSATPTIVLYLVNGTYTYTVAHVNGYVVTHATGHLVIAGSPVAVAVTFTAVSGPLPPGGSTESVALRALLRAIELVRGL